MNDNELLGFESINIVSNFSNSVKKNGLSNRKQKNISCYEDKSLKIRNKCLCSENAIREGVFKAALQPIFLFDRQNFVIKLYLVCKKLLSFVHIYSLVAR